MATVARIMAVPLYPKTILSSVTRKFPKRIVSRHSFSSLVSWEVESNETGSSSIGIITLNSPSTYNALTVEMGKDFSKLVTQLEDALMDPHQETTVGAIVLRGEGDKAFSAGGDLAWLSSLSQNSVHANVDTMLSFYQSFLCFREKLPVPVIGALDGPAIGAGACLALACDMRIMSSGHKKILGFPFSRLGIPTGMGAQHLLETCSKLSSSQVCEILLLGKTLTGEEALEYGLANALVPSDDLVLPKAKELAMEISTTSHPVAVRSMVRSLRVASDGKGLLESLYRDAHAQAMCYNRADWGKGLEAAMEKKVPDFDGYHSK